MENLAELRKCDLFKNLEDYVIKELLTSAEITTYKKGQTLFHKGDIPAGLFVIRSGKVGIYNEDVQLAILGDLAILGESFLANETATVTIVAESDLYVIIIKKEVFYTLAHIYPQLVINIFAINFHRLRNSNNTALLEARSKEEKLEKLVMERTKDLNATLADLSETRDNLIQTQKFRDQFMANMSHEIRTPMNAVLGMTNILLEKKMLPEQMKYLKGIKKSSENLLVIINDILDLSKIEAGKMELEQTDFSLPEVVNLVQETMQHKAEEKGLAMQIDFDDTIPQFLLGDPTRLNQILINLCGNAIKFTEKGSVTISLKALNLTDTHCEIDFAIQDTGIGMNEEQLGKIFQSFTQASSDTTRKYGGTGLGLTISKQLVELYGGTIAVTSQPGHGSRFGFKINFPIATEEATHSNEQVITQEILDALKGIKVLLADDNMMNRMVAVDTLEMKIENIQITEAENGQDAIDKLNADDYHIILMDVQMPVVDGLEATRRIRSEFASPKKDTTILALTASVIRSDIDACTKAGMNGYIPKPFTIEDLVIGIYEGINRA
ncbi:MAG: ATP-binding protein [Bacteroidota bacterium]